MIDPILITGAPRSGKTIVANILRMCGVFTGITNNMLENEIFDLEIAPYLTFIGSDPLGHRFIPETITFIPDDIKKDIIARLINQGYRNGKYILKSSRIVITYQLWQSYYPDARYVIVRRNKHDIVDSCIKTGYMNSFQTKDEWSLMIDAYEKKIEEIKGRVKYIEVWPEKMTYGDYSEMYKMIGFLGLSWKDEIMVRMQKTFSRKRKINKL